MLKFENKITDFILKYKEILFIYIITAVAILLRISGFPFSSMDMEYCLLPWFKQFCDNGGIKHLSENVGDYNLLYQTIISMMTYLDSKFTGAILYKTFSIIFDCILAFSFAMCLKTIVPLKTFSYKWSIGYASILLLPPVILNSSFWGQCDSIYTTFMVLTFLYIIKEKYLQAFVLYGIALAFKLQAIFMLPFLIAYYLYKRKFSIFIFVISIFTFWISGILAYINGRGLLDAFKIYMNQTNIYHKMCMGNYNFWTFIGNNYYYLKNFGIFLTVGLIITGIYAVLTGKKKFETNEQILNTLCWILWTCIMFLPAMHDRYAYPLEIFLIMLCFINIKYLKYAVISVLVTLVAYSNYLFNSEQFIACSFVYLLAYIHYTYYIFKLDYIEKSTVNSEKIPN